MNGCVFHAEDSPFYLVVKECYLRVLIDRRYSIVVLKEEYRNHLSRRIEILSVCPSFRIRGLLVAKNSPFQAPQ